MAEQTNGNSSNTAIIIVAVTALLAIGGIGGFLYWKKSKDAKLIADPKSATPPIEDKTPSGGESVTVTEVQKKDAFDKPLVLTHNKANEIDNSGIGGGLSTAKVVKLAGDKLYEYKKQDGVWFTRKVGNSNWSSLKGNATAINTLSKAFPNL